MMIDFLLRLSIDMRETDRRAAILGAMAGRPVVPVRELVDLTGASSATLRRDLARMEEEGLVRRVHGGISEPEQKLPATLGAPTFSSQRVKNADRKSAIAALACGLVEDGESIIINAGTTTFAMVDFLRDRRLNILTNSFPIAEALIRGSENRITLPGGEVYREQGIILSPFEDDTIQNLHATTMFMSAAAITPLGVVEADPLVARAEAKLLSRAERLIVLADSTKFDPRGSLVVCPLSRVSVLVTDDGISEAALAMMENAGLDVRIAPVAKEIASAA
ncbi:DeoR/GlpR family DNA-binding transcription regulator [Mesorhizobium sp. CN2-181]|uniref:DeoR/GlpR family DNA-binding transcription regulator n=1 Tax=Mesorhizobium yinganensis TaxID=3157707 RepID=UPI0032B80E31